MLRKRCRLNPPNHRPCERQRDGGWAPGDRGAPEGVVKAAFTDLPRPGPSTLRCDLATAIERLDLPHFRPSAAPQGSAQKCVIRSFAGRCRPHRDVSDPKPGLETQPFIEGVAAGICSAALHQDVVAVSSPRMSECSQHHRLAMTLASQLRVGDNILQEPVAPSAAKQIRGNDEHAGCRDPIAILGYEYVDARVRQSFLPDALGAFARLRDCADLRHIEKREKR